jgi:hypothetical protein
MVAGDFPEKLDDCIRRSVDGITDLSYLVSFVVELEKHYMD